MKKRIISAALAALLTTLPYLTAYADPVTGGVVVDPVYTVVIPAGVELLEGENSVSTIRIYGENEQSGVVVADTEYINVGLSNSENDFNVVYDEEYSIPYTVNGKNSTSDLDELAVCSVGEMTSEDIVFNLTGEAVCPGSYYDTLTFTVSCRSKVIDVSGIHGMYSVKDGFFLTGTAPDDAHITIPDGNTVTLEDCTITALPNDNAHAWAGITFEGDGTLIIEGVNKVKSGLAKYPGIKSAPNKTLTIMGSGSLEATSDGSAAGIGSGYNMGCGNIIIESGTITANGGSYGAGIGSSDYYSTCGDITINGGNVTARGGRCAAGIGSGGGSTNGPYGNACGNITITGGMVCAYGGESGPGIGSGDQNGCKDITISGGDVTASGGLRGAGIGSGGRDGSIGSYCENITISGGEVTAFGGNYAAGIGTGGVTTQGYSPTCKNISITGGKIIAKGKNTAAAIGTGGYGECYDITIESTVTSVTVIKGGDSQNFIGIGVNGSCKGTITIENDANIITEQ